LKVAAIPIQTAMETNARRAPSPTYPDIGHLADNIVVKVSITKKRGAVAKIGPDKAHWYGAFQEFGTPFVPAAPFIRPALDNKGNEAVTILADELGTGIEREAKSISGK
jgi:HK97 gp10 family phage protein